MSLWSICHPCKIRIREELRRQLFLARNRRLHINSPRHEQTASPSIRNDPSSPWDGAIGVRWARPDSTRDHGSQTPVRGQRLAGTPQQDRKSTESVYTSREKAALRYSEREAKESQPRNQHAKLKYMSGNRWAKYEGPRHKKTANVKSASLPKSATAPAPGPPPSFPLFGDLPKTVSDEAQSLSEPMQEPLETSPDLESASKSDLHTSNIAGLEDIRGALASRNHVPKQVASTASSPTNPIPNEPDAATSSQAYRSIFTDRAAQKEGLAGEAATKSKTSPSSTDTPEPFDHTVSSQRTILKNRSQQDQTPRASGQALISSQRGKLEARIEQQKPPSRPSEKSMSDEDRLASAFGGGGGVTRRASRSGSAEDQSAAAEDPRTRMSAETKYRKQDTASTEKSEANVRETTVDELTPRRASRRPVYGADETQEDGEHTLQKKSKGRGRFLAREDEAEADYGRKSSRYELDDVEIDPDLQKLRESRETRKRAKQAKKQAEAEQAAARRTERAERMAPIRIPDFVTMTRLAQMLNVTYRELEDTMECLGFTTLSPDHILSAENAGLAAIEHNFDPSEESQGDDRDLHARPLPEDKSTLPSRPPVVAIMGHVDHGKTTLLDYLRKTAVAAGEHGGITQHIGAFSVPLSSGKTITFLDTPGHSAFLAMRQRGAIVTDIIILVVAADDSVKPQTIEALKHAKEAGVPIIVAVNKIDKEEADIQRVKNDLANSGVEIEEFGGDTQVICVSGKTGQGMDELEEAAITLSEILDHRADPNAPVEGWIIEATLKTSGRCATVLVRQGTLKIGDIIVAGGTYARVRTLRNEAGELLSEATPGMPVEVEGWRDEPSAGDEVLEAPSEQKAQNVVEYRNAQSERRRLNKDVDAVNKARQLEEQRKAEEQDNEQPQAQGEEPGPTTVPFIVKADVSGSVEAVNDYIRQMANPICSPRILRSGVGAVSEFDIDHAAVANGYIVAFNLPRDPQSIMKAERQGVKILYQDVIYRIVEDVKEILESKLPAVVTQRVLGEAEVASIFEIGLGGRKKMAVAGCRVRNGVISRRAKVRVLRGETKIFDGAMSSLKNVKKDVDEMRKGSECGIAFVKWQDFRPGDTIQTYEEIKTKRTLQL